MCFIQIPSRGISARCIIVSLENKKIASLISVVLVIAFNRIFLCLFLTLSSNVMTSTHVYSSFVSLAIVSDVFGPIHCLKPFIRL